MDLNDLHLSDPMVEITSERSTRVGELYDDFAKHSDSPVERPLLTV